MQFGGGLTHVSPRKHVLDGGQGRTNPLASARGDKTAMRPFVKIIWPLVANGTAVSEYRHLEYRLSPVRQWTWMEWLPGCEFPWCLDNDRKNVCHVKNTCHLSSKFLFLNKWKKKTKEELADLPPGKTTIKTDVVASLWVHSHRSAVTYQHRKSNRVNSTSTRLRYVGLLLAFYIFIHQKKVW